MSEDTQTTNLGKTTTVELQETKEEPLKSPPLPDSAQTSFAAIDSFLQKLQSYTPDKPLNQEDIQQLRRVKEETQTFGPAEENKPAMAAVVGSEESSAVPTFFEQMGPCNEYGEFPDIKPFHKKISIELPPEERLYVGHREVVLICEAGCFLMRYVGNYDHPSRVSSLREVKQSSSRKKRESSSTVVESQQVASPRPPTQAKDQDIPTANAPSLAFEKPKPGDVVVRKEGNRTLFDVVKEFEAQNISKKRIFLGQGYHEYNSRLHIKAPISLLGQKRRADTFCRYAAGEGATRLLHVRSSDNDRQQGWQDPLDISQVRAHQQEARCPQREEQRYGQCDVLLPRGVPEGELARQKQRRVNGYDRKQWAGLLMDQQAEVYLANCSMAFGRMGVSGGNNTHIFLKDSSIQNVNVGCEILDGSQVGVAVPSTCPASHVYSR
eukprot:761797-Hanusia_phi.AAC.5